MSTSASAMLAMIAPVASPLTTCSANSEIIVRFPAVSPRGSDSLSRSGVAQFDVAAQMIVAIA